MHPAKPDHEAPVAPTCLSLAPAIKARAPTILLVEDDAFVRNVAYEILLAARNAADAVCAFRGHPDRVQLLLTDVVLPDRDGCDLARELGKIESGLKAIFHLRLSGKFRHPAGASASPLALFAQTIFRFAVTAESQGSSERVLD